MAVTIDPNTWYTILNNASNYDLALLTSPAIVNWQLLCPSTIDSAYPAEQFIIRPQGYPDSCLTPVPSSSSLSITVCDPSTALWEVDSYVNPDGGSGLLIWNHTWGYLTSSCDTCSTFVLQSNLPEYPAAAAAEFSFASVSPVNDGSWLTLPWTSSISSSPSTTAIQAPPLSVNTPDSAATSTSISSPTPAAAATSASPSSPAAATAPASSLTPAAATSSESSSIPAAATTSPPSSPSTTSPSQSVTTYFSVVDKNLADFLGPTVASLLLPPYAEVGCEKCIASGNIDVTASDTTSAVDFLEDGSIDMDFSNFAAEIDLDVELLPGFSVADTFLTLYNKTLGTIDIASDLTLEFVLAFGIPLNITLDSTVILTGGFTININQANVHIDVADISSSTATGFDISEVRPGNFAVSAPDLAFIAETGLALKIYATATASAGSDFSVEGQITFEVAVPSLTITATVDSNVDDDCKPNGKHKHAIDLTLETVAKVSADGELSLKYKEDLSKKLNSTELGKREFPIYVPDEEQCLYDSRLEAAFLGVAAVASGAVKGEAGRVGLLMLRGEVVWCFVTVWLSVFLWVESL